MPKLDLPLLLSPVFRPKPWGRTDLAPLFDGPQEESAAKRGATLSKSGRPKKKDPIGEVWLTADAARLRTGPVAGMTLDEASRQYGADLHGAAWKHDRFPILAKYLFTSDWLSLQVHPDDAYARLHEGGSLGKCETWFFLESRHDAACLLGTKPGTSLATLRSALARGQSRETLYRFRPEVDEAVFVPPGTLHALGPNLILFEVEQNSDLTYRLDDWGRRGPDGRPRALHVEKALAVARTELLAHRDLPRLVSPEPYGSRRHVLACRFFALEDWIVDKMATLEGSPERVEAFTVVCGKGRLETAAGWLGYRTGETWLIPPGIQNYRIVPLEHSRLLKFYVPDIERDFEKPLADHGAPREEMNRLVFR